MSLAEADIVKALAGGDVAMAKGVSAWKGWPLHEVRDLMTGMANKGALVRVGPGYRLPREADEVCEIAVSRDTAALLVGGASNGNGPITLADIADRFTPTALKPRHEPIKRRTKYEASFISSVLAAAASVGRAEAAQRAGIRVELIDKWRRRARDVQVIAERRSAPAVTATPAPPPEVAVKQQALLVRPLAPAHAKTPTAGKGQVGHSQEFKSKALRRALEIGVAGAAQELNVHITSIYDWRKQRATAAESLVVTQCPKPGESGLPSELLKKLSVAGRAALENGTSDIPAVSETIRQKVEAQLLAADDRAAFLRRMLAEIDAL